MERGKIFRTGAGFGCEWDGFLSNEKLDALLAHPAFLL
jgi:hypothetical protein